MNQSCRIIIKLLFLLGVDLEADGLETRPWGRVAGSKSGSVHGVRQCGWMLSKAGRRAVWWGWLVHRGRGGETWEDNTALLSNEAIARRLPLCIDSLAGSR